MQNENGIRFSGVTYYTDEAYNALAYLMIRKLRRWPRLLVILTGLASIAGAVAVMIMKNEVSLPGMLVLLAGNTLCMFGLLAQRFCVRMMMAANKKGDVPQMAYRFTDDALMILTGETPRAYAYASVSRVLEMSGYLFFFMDDGQLYLLRLSDIQGGEKAFRAFLETHIAQARATKG